MANRNRPAHTATSGRRFHCGQDGSQPRSAQETVDPVAVENSAPDRSRSSPRPPRPSMRVRRVRRPPGEPAVRRPSQAARHGNHSHQTETPAPIPCRSCESLMTRSSRQPIEQIAVRGRGRRPWGRDSKGRPGLKREQRAPDEARKSTGRGEAHDRAKNDETYAFGIARPAPRCASVAQPVDQDVLRRREGRVQRPGRAPSPMSPVTAASAPAPAQGEDGERGPRQLARSNPAASVAPMNAKTKEIHGRGARSRPGN